MSDLRNVIGSKEFEQRVTNKLLATNKDIKAEHLYFSQTRDNYCAMYRPDYPENNNADFYVYQDVFGKISVHGNLYSLIPTIRHFNDIEDFENNL